MLDTLDTALLIPIVIVVLLVGLLIAMALLGKNYVKVSPNQAAVISGRRRKLQDGAIVGYRLVRGGATLVIPFLEKVEYLNLNVLTVPLTTSRAYTGKGVPVSVKAVANVKIKGDDESLRAAAERFLSMPHDQFQRLVFQTLEGHLRAILGTLTVEEINNDRQSFAQKLTSEAAIDLEKMGIGLDALTIQEISDEEGYLDALGKRRTAEVKRDAEIGEAEAKRDSKIKASLALQEGEKVRLSTEAEIALSTREAEVRRAQYVAEIEKERATAKQAGPLSEAKARQEVVAEEVRIEKIRTQEQIAVQEQEVLRKEKELEATVVKQAEAERRAAVLRAQGEQEASPKPNAFARSASPRPRRFRPKASPRPKPSKPRGWPKPRRSSRRPKPGVSSMKPRGCKRCSKNCQPSSNPPRLRSEPFLSRSARSTRS